MNRTYRIRVLRQMKLAIIFCLLPLFTLESSAEYNFPAGEDLLYNFAIRGSFRHGFGESGRDPVEIQAEGELLIKNLESPLRETYSLEFIPRNVFIVINGMAIEKPGEYNGCESFFIAPVRVVFNLNGDILELHETRRGLLSLEGIINLMPALPRETGRTIIWKQERPLFFLRGIPPINTSSSYLYSRAGEDISRIDMAGGEIIRQEQKNGHATLFTGVNTSSGEFLFHKSTGKFLQFKGKINLDVRAIKKIVPPAPADRGTSIPIPLNIRIDIEIRIEKV